VAGTEANIEVVRRSIAAVDARDVEGVLANWQDDLVFDASRMAEGVYSGKPEFRRWLEQLFESLGELRHSNLEFMTHGDSVVVLADLGIEGSSSGASSGGRLAYRYDVEGGLIKRQEVHPDPRPLLHSLGGDR
jgi:ketosteroid isomerase-like protein